MLKQHDTLKLFFVALSIFIYLGAFFIFFYTQNTGMAILAVVPVVIIAWLYGGLPGLIAGVLSLPVNIFLYQLVGVDWYYRMVQRGALLQGTVAIALIGLLFGRMSDLSRRLKKELAEKDIIQNELKRHRDNLENEVQNKTCELKTAYQQLKSSNEQLEAHFAQLQAGQLELKESRDFLSMVIDNSADGIVITDDQGSIISVNKPVEVLFRRRQNDLIGLPVETIFLDDPDMKGKATEVTQRFLDKGHATFEMRLSWPEEGMLYLDCTTTMISNAAGAYIASMTILRDISERKRMEQQIRQSQKLESIGTLAGGIAHDFNNILAAIMGYTELSLDLAIEHPRIKGNLEQVLKASDRARELVRQILKFSRQSEPDRKPILPHIIIREVMKLIRATVPSTIDIQTDIPELPHMILGDPTELHQIVMNLCTNSVHAMQDAGGVLSVRLAAVDLTDEDAFNHNGLGPGTYMQLSVSDTGMGIDQSVINRIFDPFFTTKETSKGTGMGLAVVHGIVKSYGGDIAVASRPGTGTTFSVLFPRFEAHSEPEYQRQKTLARGSERVLVVDDEEAIADSLGAMLSSLGYRVEVAHDSGQALALFKKDPGAFDLVLTDQTMPHMTGIELAREILDIRASIPIILCTGFSEAVNESIAKASGIQCFVLKPTGMQKLSEVVRSALDVRQPAAGTARSNILN